MRVNYDNESYVNASDPIPSVNMNENPDVPNNRPEIDVKKLAKVFITHEQMERILDLPFDVKITSMHTTRGEENTGIYMICNRFDDIPAGTTAPEMDIETAKNKGLWDTEAN